MWASQGRIRAHEFSHVRASVASRFPPTPPPVVDEEEVGWEGGRGEGRRVRDPPPRCRGARVARVRFRA